MASVLDLLLPLLKYLARLEINLSNYKSRTLPVGEWYDRAKAVEVELEQLRFHPAALVVAPEATALLKSAITARTLLSNSQ